jgi:hypothetical protein
MKKNIAPWVTSAALIGALSLTLTTVRAQDTTPKPAPGAPATEAPKPHQAGQAAEKHPAIHKAIVALFDAKRDLERADHDFGGHRKQAIEDIDRAVAQLKLALQHDKK